MFHSSSNSKSPNCSFDAMSLAWPSFCSTPLTISQQSFAPAVSHIFGALSVLKMRHALIVLPSKSDFHGPGFGAAGWRKTALSRNGMVQVMFKMYITTDVELAKPAPGPRQQYRAMEMH